MKQNKYVEYRTWVFFWGLFKDGEEEVQKVLDKYNNLGWNCVQFEWNSSMKLSFFRGLLVWFLTLITLGLVSYWSGFSIVFEREIGEVKPTNTESSTMSSTSNSAFEEWKLNNPGKSLNDFYAEKKVSN